MKTIMIFDVDYLKPISECTPDEMEFATEDGCWLFYGEVDAESEAEALRIVSEKMHGWTTRIHEGS